MSLVLTTLLSLDSWVTSSLDIKLLNFKEVDRFMCWHSTIKSKIVVLHDNGTWSLVSFKPSMNMVGC
jgi:short subunit fatty acids transporter